MRTSFWNLPSRYRSIPLVYRITVGFALGSALGLVAGERATALAPIGDLFLRLLEMLVVPIVVVTLFAGVQRLSPERLGRVGGVVVGLYAATTAVAAAIGLAFANLLNPGTGVTLDGAEADSADPPSLVDVALGIVPENPIGAMAGGDLLATIFFTVVFGLALAIVADSTDDEAVRSGAESLVAVAEAASEALFKIVWGVMEFGVLGVFALMAASLGEEGLGAVVPLAMLVATVVLAVVVHVTVTYLGVITVGLVGQSPTAFLAGAKDAMITAFSTRSSSGTLPVTMANAEDDLRIDESVYGFSLPLGSTANMDGAAIRLAVTAVFAANVVGQPLALAEQVSVLVIAVLISIGTAGVPGAGLVMLTVVLTQLGLPLEIVGLVAGVDPILGRFATANNVTGDLAVSTLAAKWNDAIDFSSGVWTDGGGERPSGDVSTDD
ncbi:dicarboxylate/amino acid:cation symporter [Halegenticoccus tardaugens]|uniref:dicarboxylate/amino acid:cation symporter n=1 Tax=Halegenticoccus tardaugens TaxID=2071624 RepID=UPI00100A7911|nr:dicarboxylate/amino acid:cation symporter [Halegenticoccus tardaugens]